ncbi:MAG TPA: LuxR family transcriptional regulator [Candidatus Limnocylindria bacterium]|nr:LuxR family transcriptional regulator [Candidatus Limnocylindria bacterium]
MSEITPRERDVLDRLVAGLSNKDVADGMGIAEQTVKAHVARLFLKFHVTTRAGLAVAAVKAGVRAPAPQVAGITRFIEEEEEKAVDARAMILARLIGNSPAILADDEGRIVLANPAFHRAFARAVYQDERGLKLPKEATPIVRAARGERRTMRFRIGAGTKKSAWWEAVGQPIKLDGDGQGVLVTFLRLRAKRA